MPKIRDLNPLPGTPDGTEATWIDKGNADFYATLQQIANFTLGNIKVVNNSNGVSFRLPQARIQVCFHRLQAVHIGSGAYLRIPEWEYPEAFDATPRVFFQLINEGSNYAPPPEQLQAPMQWTGASRSQMGNARLYSTSGGFAAGDTINVDAIAIGRY